MSNSSKPTVHRDEPKLAMVLLFGFCVWAAVCLTIYLVWPYAPAFIHQVMIFVAVMLVIIYALQEIGSWMGEKVTTFLNTYDDDKPQPRSRFSMFGWLMEETSNYCPFGVEIIGGIITLSLCYISTVGWDSFLRLAAVIVSITSIAFIIVYLITKPRCKKE